MQKKQDTSTKYHNIKISSKEIFELERIISLYLLEQEALNYKNTKDIKGYSFYMKLKHLIGLYELQNPSTD